MTSRLSPPFVWPEATDPDRAPRYVPKWAHIPDPNARVTIAAAECGLDFGGLDFLRGESPSLRLRPVSDGAREA